MTTAVQVQYRRGTASQVAAFTGAQGELIVDTTNNRVVVQDGATAGGFPAAKLYDLPGGMRNRFRNGTMDVWQRGTSAMTVTTAGAYTADGWIVVPTGASCGAQVGAGRLITVNSLQVYGGTGVTDAIVKQRIESYVAASLTTRTVTVQAQVYNNTGASITPLLTVKHAGSADNWTGPTTDVSAVSLQACANAAWTRIAYTFTDAGYAANGLEISFDFGNNFSTSGKSVQLAELDIRDTPGVPTGLNSNPPPPELRPIATELAFCQRYYYRRGAQSSSDPLAQMHAASSTAVIGKVLDFPVEMRASPTINISGAGHLSLFSASASTTYTVTSITNWSSGSQFALSTLGGITASSGALTAGNVSTLEFNTTSGWIDASAEL
jgi:hypothetical protein